MPGSILVGYLRPALRDGHLNGRDLVLRELDRACDKPRAFEGRGVRVRDDRSFPLRSLRTADRAHTKREREDDDRLEREHEHVRPWRTDVVVFDDPDDLVHHSLTLADRPDELHPIR